MVKQTAGRDSLGEFAPQFAALNDDVLFGQVWSRESKLSLRDRSLVTVSVLMGKGILDDSLRYHLISARNNGISRAEIAEILTHAAFYAGWPNAWAVFKMAKEVYADGDAPAAHGGLCGMGEPNTAYAPYFTGISYLKPLNDPKTCPVFLANITFEPGCRNHWHTHTATAGGGQILFCIEGEGWYQEEGKPARSLAAGDVVVIPANVKHWHGAKADSWFSHIAIEVPGIERSTIWDAPVTDEEYIAL